MVDHPHHHRYCNNLNEKSKVGNLVILVLNSVLGCNTENLMENHHYLPLHHQHLHRYFRNGDNVLHHVRHSTLVNGSIHYYLSVLVASDCALYYGSNLMAHSIGIAAYQLLLNFFHLLRFLQFCNFVLKEFYNFVMMEMLHHLDPLVHHYQRMSTGALES